MPYASKKQSGWMHAHEPGIAAKWDKEQRKKGKRKKGSRKAKGR